MKRRNKISLPKVVSANMLFDLYITQGKSVAQMAKILGYSQNSINYWLVRCEIPKRTISDAMRALKKSRD